MKAIILAAGRGTRLVDLGSDLPKCLLPLNSQSSLEWYRRSFDRVGVVDDVIVVGGYRIDTLRERKPPGFALTTLARDHRRAGKHSCALQAWKGMGI